MALAQLFRSPFVRIPFLAFAVFSSVATSAPDGWALVDGPPRERIDLPDASIALRAFTYETSESEATITVSLSKFSTKTGKLRVTVEGCGVDKTFAQYKPDRWSPEGDPGGSWDAMIYTRGTCAGARGAFTVRIENLGGAPIAFDSDVKVSVGNSEVQETPAGAFLRVQAAQ